MEDEIWKNIPSFDGKLQASSNGNIREYIIAINSKGEKFIYKSKQLKLQKTKEGYFKIGYNRKTYSASRLIAETFILNYSKEMYVKCMDGNNINLNINNLKMVDFNEMTGNFNSGTNNYKAKLNDNKVIEITNKLLQGEAPQQLADNYNICLINIYRLARKEIWKHVDRPFISLRKLKKTKHVKV